MRTTSAQQNAAGQAAPQNQSTVRQAAISPLPIRTCWCASRCAMRAGLLQSMKKAGTLLGDFPNPFDSDSMLLLALRRIAAPREFGR